ncbi:pyruvate kinase [Mesoplasma lactucae]|uniref:Pyruvate kinase n=1 Tax=Mesoplasma lactucae ATCC 49193 TaxID=81460 RepID=A0A291ISY9_9MOLU|nr:pyruvate kinase [Mesoplasma lactucae ATCC 49193]
MTKADLAKRVKRTKIVTTIGPATHNTEDIQKLYENGMNTIRLNFSHGSYDEHGARIASAKSLRESKNEPISIMLDTKGPEIRVGKFKDGAQQVSAGQKITIYTDADSYANKDCGQGEMTVAYDMSQDLKPGDVVLIDDGKLEMTVDSVKPGVVMCTAFNPHVVKTNKRVNLPGVDFSMPFLADKDKADLKYGCEQKVDYVAASFVNTADNIKEIRDIFKANNQEDIQIFAKIESQVGINNIDAIIAAADGIMVARGDLGLEIPYWEVPQWEKIIIEKCRVAGKPVIVATQMLDTMTDNPAPTRAEVTDVYEAVMFGADATMLSGETAAGSYPFITVNTMATIDKRAEIDFYDQANYKALVEQSRKTTTGANADIASKVSDLAFDGKYQFAVVLDEDGALLKTLSKFRPNLAILGVSTSERLWTAFGAWASVYMNKVADLTKVDDAAMSQIAKTWGAKSGDKVLAIKAGNVTELTVA